MSGFAPELRECLAAGSLMAYPVAFCAGLLISFTPCVYPVIPIQLGFIGGQTASAQPGGARELARLHTVGSVRHRHGDRIRRARSLRFADRLAVRNLGFSPWTYTVVGNVILLMALSTLDVIRLPAPTVPDELGPSTQRQRLRLGVADRRVVRAGRRPLHGPRVGSRARLCRRAGQCSLGTTVLFVFAVGMGALMIALGACGGALTSLPRSGEWMVKVKKGFGFAIVLMAQYLFVQAGRRFI